MPQPQLHVTVIRHGETNSNLNHILQGQIDTKMNRTGMEQAESVGRRLRKLKIDHIYTSDLIRAKKTANAIAKHHPDTPLSTDMRIRERDFGRLSGLSIHDALDLIKNEGLTWDDYGEPEEDFKARVVDFFNDIVATHLPRNSNELPLDSKQPGKRRNPHIVIVAHGGTINRLVKQHVIMDLGFHVNDYLSMKHKAKNTSVTKFVVRRKKTGDDLSNIIGIDDDDATSVVSSDSNNSMKDDDNNSEKAMNSRRDIERKIRLEGEVGLWSCVSHLSSIGKRTHGDSQIDEFVH
ncbi:histidine phosphatase superfamily [Glomus cerebriforme]|uniref:Histidine phosphatase superfamily n=1 Tax=Glomus cerebriforme TaxID=658196 RepID=A0A397TLD4_9GLOM|nr:histidine phosphatase superfamily [Glomus cerebriforme]